MPGPRMLFPALVLLASLPAYGAAAKARPGGTLSLRKRLHINSLITDPGTIEIDWGAQYSLTSSQFDMPTTFKYTPRGPHVAWGRTEYSVSLDPVTSADSNGERVTQFGPAATFNATSVLYDGPHFDVAFAPQATVFFRGEAGMRLGATGIARYDRGRSSLGATVSWSGATRSSPTNPAGLLDAGIGFGQNLAGSALAEKFTPHCNAVWEHATGGTTSLSVFEGIEFQMTGRLALDVSGQHAGVRGGNPDHQIVVSLTLNLGRVQ